MMKCLYSGDLLINFSFMPSIARFHEKIIDNLIQRRKTDPNLHFAPRQRNTNGRLAAGYWFLGNEYYAFVSLWNGRDWKEKVNCIGFVVLHNKVNYIELSAQGCPEVVPFLEKLAKLEPGLVRSGKKNKWFKYFDNHDYLKNFDYFVEVFKPKVDTLIASEQPPKISVISPLEFSYFGQKAIDARLGQVAFGRMNKITRLSWNTNSWRSPSGSVGKSRNQDTHEGKYGFGFEEWLFDFSMGFDGFKYGFIKGFESKNDIHAGKMYNVHLYSQNNLGGYFYLGHIKEVEGIAMVDSAVIYDKFKANGWLGEMEKTILQVEADLGAFRTVDPKVFVNVRFRVTDVVLLEDMEELAWDDDNVTTDRFKLLPFKGRVVAEIEPLVAHEDLGNFKNTELRKRVFNGEQVYDPYHDKMQNAIVEHLRSDLRYGYVGVHIEKGRVDVKAVNAAGEWDFFEIKTENPKRCVRTALGQVMEYAYFPSAERAARIIVVGDTEPDADTVRYLDYLRERFSLPLTYRYFKFETGVLSDDF
ncbi:MAG: hypothetical protein EOO20_09245 [Chryseobacterium sp.]|nr:MAG: hypothetical protein EOO20_09245 [Chryseobacterium sp.]